MKEEEIRKRDVFNRYLQLVEKDARELFRAQDFMDITCPACDSNDSIFQFEKIGFRYVRCKHCGTLFANPRPSFSDLRNFYSKSSSIDYWINEFFKPVAESRREKIFLPRAEYINKMLSKPGELVIGDVGAGFGIFIEELRKLAPQNHYIAVEPSVKMVEICRGKKIDVRCSCFEEMEGMEKSFDLLTAFELLEHLYDPRNFLKMAYSLLKPGAYIYITTLNSNGFDILLLWERSKSIAPPHHLNFFNPESIRILLESAGFEVREILTPGKLDWDIVEGMITKECVAVGRFWELLALEGSEKTKKALQEWISGNLLSSHMSVLARKPDA